MEWWSDAVSTCGASSRCCPAFPLSKAPRRGALRPLGRRGVGCQTCAGRLSWDRRRSQEGVGSRQRIAANPTPAGESPAIPGNAACHEHGISKRAWPWRSDAPDERVRPVAPAVGLRHTMAPNRPASGQTITPSPHHSITPPLPYSHTPILPHPSRSVFTPAYSCGIMPWMAWRMLHSERRQPVDVLAGRISHGKTGDPITGAYPARAGRVLFARARQLTP